MHQLQGLLISPALLMSIAFTDQIIWCIHCTPCLFQILCFFTPDIFYWPDYLVHPLLHTLLVSHALLLYICCILITRLLSAPLASLADFTCFVNVLCILLTRYLLHCLHRLTSNINGFYICICFITQVCYCTRCIVG